MLKETNMFDDNTNDEYVLMNKDEELIEFKLNSDDIFEIAVETKVYRKPSWIKNLTEFLSARKAPLRREHISDLLKQCGCDTLKGYLDFTYALSLNDTMWVKKISEKLEWKSVSLYRNEFDETIAKIAFSGGMYGEQFSSLTPELGTNGQFPKCWVREDNNIFLIKTGSKGARNVGLEPYSEYYGSDILPRICDSVVDYDLVYYRDKLATKCRLFTSEEYGFVPMMYMNYGRTLPTLYQYVKGLGFGKEFADMIVGDTVIMNEDRHLGNFGVFINNNTFGIEGFAPLFDHNLSMLCYADEEDLKNPEEYMRDGNKGHKLGGGSFLDLGRKFLSSENKRKLRGLIDFKIDKHWKYNLEDWRLDILSKQVNNQVKGLLG